MQTASNSHSYRDRCYYCYIERTRIETSMLKVLIVINHAPDYREPFFRELAMHCDLTVIAQPCSTANLTPPNERKGYHYIEIMPISFKGIVWQRGINKILYENSFDIYCVDFNPRMISTFWIFLTSPHLQSKWVWRGSVYGNSESRLLEKFRGLIFRKARSTLVYSKEIAARITKEYGVPSISFNNTEVSTSDIQPIKVYNCKKLDTIKIIFVGRYQERKKLERLISLAKLNKKVELRLIGPNMDVLTALLDNDTLSRVQIFGRLVGSELIPHFEWADVVFNPGHAGLLVLNAAKHGRAIVIDSNSKHAPEYFAAKESGQIFLPFDDLGAVNQWVEWVLENPENLTKLASQHQELALKEYTFE